MLNFDRDRANEPDESIGQQGFPGQVAYNQFHQGYSPGTIRNTLGSGLKASGFFQKDGQLKNLRGGFIGNRQQPFSQGTPYQPAPYGANPPGFMPQQQNGYRQDMNNQEGYDPGLGYTQNQGYYSGQTRQLILEAAQQGIVGTGVATITPDNNFILIANLPAPQMFLAPGQTGQYASYLVDDKGKTGFLAGILKPVGNGVYRTHFQSPVPLHHYSRAVISLENPAQLGQAPYGPIILKVKEPKGVMMFLNPMKNTATSVWGKVSGFMNNRKKAAPNPETAPINLELGQPLQPNSPDPATLVQQPASLPPMPTE